jgi:hypothetical protein
MVDAIGPKITEQESKLNGPFAGKEKVVQETLE